MGTSVGYRTTLEAPSVFTCKDFGGQCCNDCHTKGHVIALYPWSVYSEGKKDKMPDFSMGLRAEVCCGQFHVARELPREWWVRRYCEKQKWGAADTERLVRESDSANFLKERGNLIDKNYSGPRPTAAPAKRRVTATGRGCPECGAKWDGIACDNCGHS